MCMALLDNKYKLTKPYVKLSDIEAGPRMLSGFQSAPGPVSFGYIHACWGERRPDRAVWGQGPAALWPGQVIQVGQTLYLSNTEVSEPPPGSRGSNRKLHRTRRSDGGTNATFTLLSGLGVTNRDVLHPHNS